MQKIYLILIAVALAGCSTPKQLPPRAKQAYRYVFYGLHRRLTPYEDTRARKLFVDYIETRNKWEEDEACPCSCNFNDMADWDRMMNAEFEVYNFIDSIR